jgi:hypothetical protein
MPFGLVSLPALRRLWQTGPAQRSWFRIIVRELDRAMGKL